MRTKTNILTVKTEYDFDLCRFLIFILRRWNMNRTEALNNYYGIINEDARIKNGHGRIEFLTTVHYIEKYVKPGMKILEVGAGTGIYSHYFAHLGYEVDAVELVEKNIAIFKQNITSDEKISITQGNAVDLAGYPDDTYDIVLLLGPLYHLSEDAEKLSAINEALRVAKKDGVIFCAYCLADFSILRCFQRGRYEEYVSKGMLDPVTFQTVSHPEDIFELHTIAKIDALMKQFDVERLHFVATDLFAHYIGREIDTMSDTMFEAYLNYHYTVCERKDLVGASAHALDVFRKKS